MTNDECGVAEDRRDSALLSGFLFSRAALAAVSVGFREILAHKFRSVLTMLGIVLGVSSLVAMAAIVKGMENGMKEAMIALGGLDKVLTREAPVPVWQSHLADQAPGRTIKDVEALRRSAP